MRTVLLPVAAAMVMSATAALADNKSDCQKGVAMIKAKHSRRNIRHLCSSHCKALGDAETEVMVEVGPSAWTTSRPRA
jgi:hypothetical protein